MLVAKGEAEIGLQQVSELMSNPDVEVIGMLPDTLQQITINAAGITAIAKEPDAARGADPASDDAGGARDLQGQRFGALTFSILWRKRHEPQH